MTENDYVATATAEKRLREVLAARFGNLAKDLIDELAAILLTDAEITYLPRKKSVSILLRYPEKASQAILDRPRATDLGETGDWNAAQDTEPEIPSLAVLTPEERADVPQPPPYQPKVARFGEFVPTVTSNPDYHNDDYFTE